MNQNHTTRPFFLLFLAMIVTMTLAPPVMGWLGVAFSSPIQGGAGAQLAGFTTGDVLWGFDLTVLGFAGLIGVLTVLYHRATGSRFSRLLGLTMALFGLVDGLRLVRGMTLPEGSITFFDGALTAVAIDRVGGGLVLLLGAAVIRRGKRGGTHAADLQIAVPGAALVAATWWAMAAFTSPARLPLLDLNLAATLCYLGAAALLRAELRHHRLRFFGRGVLAAFIPLVVAQALLTFRVETIVDDTFHIAQILRWFAWLVPAAGLGIDFVNSFYARDVSLEIGFLRTIIDSVPHFIYTRDTNGRYTLVNRATAEFYGRQVHEVEGRHVMDVHPEVGECRAWLAEDQETLRRGGTYRVDGTAATHPDGGTVWMDTIKTPLRSPLTAGEQVLGVSIDVTEQRRADEALAEALEAAKESSKAKSEFLANMSHEIRTPMNCIIGLADLLTEMDGDARQRQYLDMIRMSGSSLLTLINDILDISKIEAGQLELDIVDTDLQTLVEETAGLIAFNAQSKGLEMVCRLAPGVPTRLMLDPGRLRQVLTNLLNNATKFTRQGHIYLNIEPVGERDGKLDLCFRVTDTGIGIEPDNLERIFEKFTQAEAGTTRRFGGTGLGLSISQHLVRLMGGRITATSELGRGTTFSFTIPVASTQPEMRAGVAAPMNTRRVLVLTDHDLGGEVLAEQVRSLGSSCRVAVGDIAAEEALVPAAGQEPWHVILADQSFFAPERRMLRDHLAHLDPVVRPRVLMLNNLSRLQKDDELERLGCDGSLSKPVRLSHLAAALMGNPASGPAVAASPVVVPAAPEHVDKDPEHGPRILLAEDNPFNQKVAVAMLRLLGCRVEVAGTGVEAVDQARTGGYDLVLMDCQMPVMDGYEATARIRKLPGAAGEVLIIAMTANALSGDREACFAAGMNDFMSKPITRDMLQRTLRKWGVVGAAKVPS